MTSPSLSDWMAGVVRLGRTALRRDAMVRFQVAFLAAILALGLFAGLGEWPA